MASPKPISPCPLQDTSFLEILITTEDKVLSTQPALQHKDPCVPARGDVAITRKKPSSECYVVHALSVAWPSMKEQHGADCWREILLDRSRADYILEGRVHVCTPPWGYPDPTATHTVNPKQSLYSMPLTLRKMSALKKNICKGQAVCIYMQLPLLDTHSSAPS